MSYRLFFVLGMGPVELLAMMAWMVVGLSCTWAVFSQRIHDTTLERVALASISISSYSGAYYVLDRGTVSYDATATAVSIAFYCLVIWLKHRRERRRYDDV